MGVVPLRSWQLSLGLTLSFSGCLAAKPAPFSLCQAFPQQGEGAEPREEKVPQPREEALQEQEQRQKISILQSQQEQESRKQVSVLSHCSAVAG